MANEDYKHGSMNVDSQERVFEGFVKWVTNSTIVIIAILIFLAIFWT